MTQLKAVRIPVFELFAPDGSSMGLFRVESEWNGMRALKSLHGQRAVIVDGDPTADGIFAGVFGDIFGTKPGDGLTVLKASPDILAELARVKA